MISAERGVFGDEAVAGGGVDHEGGVESGFDAVVDLPLYIFPERNPFGADLLDELLHGDVHEGPAAGLQSCGLHRKAMFLLVGGQSVRQVEGVHVGGVEVGLRLGSGEVQDAGIGGGLLEDGQIAEVGDPVDAEAGEEFAERLAVAAAHPLVGDDVDELAAVAEQPHALLDEIDVEVGGAGVGLEGAFEVGLEVGEFLLPDVGWVADHHVKSDEVGLVVQDLRELESPLEGVLVETAAFDLGDVLFEFLQLGCEFVGLLLAVLVLPRFVDRPGN